MSKTGDCVVKHGANFTTGFGMVVSGSCVLFNKLMSVFHVSVLLLMMNFIIKLSK